MAITPPDFFIIQRQLVNQIYSLEGASGSQSMRKEVCECVDLEGASGPQSMRNDCPESNSRIVWHLRTFVWHVKCVTCTVVNRRLNSVELRIMHRLDQRPTRIDVTLDSGGFTRI